MDITVYVIMSCDGVILNISTSYYVHVQSAYKELLYQIDLNGTSLS